MRKQSVRYVVVKTLVDHDESVDATKVCEKAELIADQNGGHIKSSEIVDVLEEKDIPAS